MFDWSTYNKMLMGGINPNEYYYLAMLSTGEDKRKIFSLQAVVHSLTKKGYLKDGELTNKARSSEFFNDFLTITAEDYFVESELSENISEYLSIFPDILLPSGAPARYEPQIIKRVFLEFFKIHKFSWDLILDATKNYVERKRNSGFEFMKNSKTFILDKDGHSALAAEISHKQTNTGIDI